MAKRRVNRTDERKSLDKKAYFVDESAGTVDRAVCDEITHTKLDTIANNIGGAGEFKVATETISALKLVTLVDPNSVEVSSSATCPEATVFGVARTAATTGNQTQVVTGGELYDSSFNYPINAPLFLDLNGNITDTPPTTGFLTQIGTSGGPGLITINIQPPIELA